MPLSPPVKPALTPIPLSQNWERGGERSEPGVRAGNPLHTGARAVTAVRHRDTGAPAEPFDHLDERPAMGEAQLLQHLVLVRPILRDVDPYRRGAIPRQKRDC